MTLNLISAGRSPLLLRSSLLIQASQKPNRQQRSCGRATVALHLEEFATKSKSQQAFDADIAPYGILALLLKVENGGTQTYRVEERGVSAYLGAESLPSLVGEKAAAQGANSEYVGKAWVGHWLQDRSRFSFGRQP